MANADRPAGLRPIGNLYGAPYNGNTIKVAFAAGNSVATFIGDIVRLEGSADSDGNPTVDQFAASDTDAFGVLVGLDPDRTNLERKHRVASTARTGYVVPAGQGQLFAIQDDGSGTAAADWVGNTADVVVGSGNTTNGISAMELNGANVGTGANLHIMGLLKAPDNTIGANAEWVVRINENSLGGDGTAS